MKLQDLLKDIELGKVYTDKNRKPFKVNEDGHTDVPSAIRKLKLSIEDSQQILQKLESMNQEDSLPAWWTDKVTLASNYLNKSRDYLLTGSKVDESFGGVSSPPPFSSKEAKMVVDDALRQYSKELRKLQGKVVKDWMTKAKAGVIDFFDLVRGFQSGDTSRAHPYEVEFLQKVLTKDKIVDRFRKYFGGKKALNNRTAKKGR
jgi:hypothetical protein|tara:strand:- start:23 stop:631 length:609 start_codon:yes stop_codon:yes gene_type:complete